MIEKGHNIEKHPYLKRIVEHEGEQINFLDSRFYKTENGDYYPSVTTVLGFYPKNKFFESWLKDVGHNSDIIVRRASEEGTQVHDAISIRSSRCISYVVFYKFSFSNTSFF